MLFVSPSDHVIRPDKRFIEFVRRSEEISKKGFIVTFGVTPDRPETGYGYIKKGLRQAIAVGEDFFGVEAFVEKPDLENRPRRILAVDISGIPVCLRLLSE